MHDEMKSLYENNTFELVKLPKGKKALKNMWVYRVKQEEHASQYAIKLDWSSKDSVRRKVLILMKSFFRLLRYHLFVWFQA